MLKANLLEYQTLENDIQNERTSLKSSKNDLEAHLTHCTTTLSQLNKKKGRARTFLAQDEAKLSTICRDHELKRKMKERLTRNLKKKENFVAEITEQLKARAHDMNEAKEKLDQLPFIDIADGHIDLIKRKCKISQELKDANSALDKNSLAIQSVSSSINTLKQSCLDNKTNLKKINRKSEELFSRIVKVKAEINQFTVSLSDIETTLKSLHRDRWTIGQEMLEASGDELRKVIHALQQKFGKSKIYGLLCDLATVESKYDAAVNSVLQRHAKVIVIKTRDIGLKVTSYFCEKKLGRVTCCIVDEIDLKSCTCNQMQQPCIKLCEVIFCDDMYRSVFHKYCGNWCVVQHTDDAIDKRLSNFDLVTLEGNLFLNNGEIRATNISCTNSKWKIKRHGDMTGSSSAEMFIMANLHQHKLRELDKDIETQQIQQLELIQSRSQLYEEVYKMEREFQDLKGIASSINRQISLHGIDLLSKQQQLTAYKNVKAELERKLKHLAKKLTEVNEHLLTKIPELESQEQRQACLDSIKQYEAQLRNLDHQSTSIPREINSLQQTIEALNKELEELGSQKSELSNSCNITKEKIDKINNDCLEIQKSSKSFQNQLSEMQDQYDKLMQQYEVKKLAQRRCRDDLQRITSEIDDYTARVIDPQPINEEEHSDFDSVKFKWDSHCNKKDLLEEEKRKLLDEKTTMSKQILSEAAVLQGQLEQTNARVHQLNQNIVAMMQNRNALINKRYKLSSVKLTFLDTTL
ncbi:hypothetical protein THRCLA_01969 [Thraustotheca clavata]|uniref:SMC hinge domain-containing protein n=1 Tax=Thraustotheca clavata TaxID=74557 RepID=A0A1W0A6W2_9STRA|nr:hypothetical protein THRCLA_01969 [Thraustotheca clavata]